MRSFVVTFLFAGLGMACADAAPRRTAPPPLAVHRVATPTVAEGPVAPRAGPEPYLTPPTYRAMATIAAPASALENPGVLRRFYDALARLEDGHAHDDVRILQFGDSHTAADFETGPIRRALQARFGDGGRGFVAIGHVYPKYVQEGLRVGNTRDFAPERGRYKAGKFSGDGCYGLGGASIETGAHGARAWADVMVRTSRIEVSYLEQPSGGSFDLFIDGGRIARVATSGHAVASAFRAFDVTEGPHQIEARAVGDGEVRIFGMTLDRPSAGLTYDALGINGARVTTVLNWSEAHMAEQLRHRAPDLVVLAYGTNEAGDDTAPATYERQLVDLLGRVSRAVPTASCLILGPPDRASRGPAPERTWATMPKLLDVIETQRRVARAAGCAFYNQFAAMGGEGSIVAWANESNARAQKDYVHLTRDGYAFLGNSFAQDLVRAYSGWRFEQGMPAPSAPVPPAVAPSPPPVPLPEPMPVAAGP